MNKPQFPLVSRMSNAQLVQRSAIVRKVMQQLGFDAKQFDVFTKKQKFSLLQLTFETPSVKAEKERTVPRHYIRGFRESLLYYLKQELYDSSEFKLTCYEMATVGFPFCLTVTVMLRKGEFREAPQRELAEQLEARIAETSFIGMDNFASVFNHMHMETSTVSQPNFRLYGYYFDWEGMEQDHKMTLFEHHRLTFYITAIESQHKYFSHKGKYRIAYRLQLADKTFKMQRKTVVCRREVFPNGLNGDFELNLYVQAHAMHRFKERLSEFQPKIRNVQLLYYLAEYRTTVQTPTGVMFPCPLDGVPLGYFSFFVQGDDLVVNTFLPVASSSTPEGKKFCDCLGFTKDELTYLGMDKQTFYLQVDFDRIPVLKQAMIDSGLWAVKEVLERFFRSVDRLDKLTIDEQHTQRIVDFFQKWETWKEENN
jgi:hypothetical protein